MPRAQRLLSFLLVGLVLAGAVSCSQFDPYVYKRNEFDREAAGFGREPTDINRVEICYNRSAATPEQILDLAREACGEFGKEPRFAYHRRLECPLATPILAHFECIGPADDDPSVK